MVTVAALAVLAQLSLMPMPTPAPRPVGAPGLHAADTLPLPAPGADLNRVESEFLGGSAENAVAEARRRVEEHHRALRGAIEGGPRRDPPAP